jgi:hypothetical protein
MKWIYHIPVTPVSMEIFFKVQDFLAHEFHFIYKTLFLERTIPPFGFFKIRASPWTVLLTGERIEFPSQMDRHLCILGERYCKCNYY